MVSYLMGLDSGLTVTKAVVFREDGQEVATGKREVRRFSNAVGHVERDMDELWAASADAIREALERASDVERAEVRPCAVGVTGHGDGLYLLDRKRQALGAAVTSLDSRAKGLLEEWGRDGTMDQALSVTGQQPFGSSPAPLLAHLKRHQPERYARIGSILTCKDWLRYCLTGEVATDFGEASASFTDVTTQAYSQAALDLFGLSDMSHALAPVLMPDAIAGKVSSKAAQRTGLIEGTPVAAGLHDVMSCAVGSGIVAEGMIAMIAGTYSINEILVSKPEYAAGWNTRNGLVPGQWNKMSVSPSSSANLDWFIGQAARDATATGNGFADLQKEIDATRGDPSEITYLPYVFGAPNAADAAGAFLGLRSWHTRGHLLRAVAEGIVFNHRHHVDLIDPQGATRRVRLTGGSSRNPYFGQLFADVLNREVEVPATEETGALGAAITGGIGVGLYADWDDAVFRTKPALQCYRPGDQVGALQAAYATYRRAVSLALTWQSGTH